MSRACCAHTMHMLSACNVLGACHTGGAPCAVPTLCHSRLFSTRFPDVQGDCGNYCVPIHRTAQISPKTQVKS